MGKKQCCLHTTNIFKPDYWSSWVEIVQMRSRTWLKKKPHSLLRSKSCIMWLKLFGNCSNVTHVQTVVTPEHQRFHIAFVTERCSYEWHDLRDCVSLSTAVCPSVFSWIPASLIWLSSKVWGSQWLYGSSKCRIPSSSVSSSPLSIKLCWSNSSWPSHTSIPESPVKRRYLPGVKSLLGLQALWTKLCGTSGIAGSAATASLVTELTEAGGGVCSGGSVGGGDDCRGV